MTQQTKKYVYDLVTGWYRSCVLEQRLVISLPAIPTRGGFYSKLTLGFLVLGLNIDYDAVQSSADEKWIHLEETKQISLQTVEVHTSKLWEQGYAVRQDGVGIEYIALIGTIAVVLSTSCFQ